MLSRNRASRAIIPKRRRQTTVDPNKSAQSQVAENLDSLIERMSLRPADEIEGSVLDL